MAHLMISEEPTEVVEWVGGVGLAWVGLFVCVFACVCVCVFVCLFVCVFFVC